MRQQPKAQELRDLLKLAKQLRTSASATENHEYVELFLRAAMILEERASLLAFGSSDAILPAKADDTPHAHIDICC
jgi:hypothetical protein